MRNSLWIAKRIPEEEEEEEEDGGEEEADLTHVVISSGEVMEQRRLSQHQHQESDAWVCGQSWHRRFSEATPLLLEANSGSQPLRHSTDCSCFRFALQGLLVLEIVSLMFYVTLLLYSTQVKNSDRNREAVGLFIYVMVVMMYELFSLQIGCPLRVRIIAAVIKAFASSVFFAFSLEHTILLPAFFFYFFPTVISTSIHIVLSWRPLIFHWSWTNCSSAVIYFLYEKH